jgi:hypothetical protein
LIALVPVSANAAVRKCWFSLGCAQVLIFPFRVVCMLLLQGRKWRLNFHFGGTQSSSFVSTFVEFLNVREFKGASKRKITFQLALMHNEKPKKTHVKDPQVNLSALRNYIICDLAKPCYWLRRLTALLFDCALQEHLFAEDSTDWGWPQFVERARIEHPDSGFIDAQGKIRIAVVIENAAFGARTDWSEAKERTVCV